MADPGASDAPVPKRPAPAGLEVLVSNRQQERVDEDDVRDVAERTLRGEGRADVELSLSFVTPEEMTELHERYMGESGPTDVLSFPLDEDGLLGDVVVCPSVAAANNTDVNGEIRLLVAHGVLHLLGYDHEDAEERAVMWAKQERYSRGGAP